VDLARVEALDLAGGDRGAENPEHRPGMKAARHDGRDKFRGHALHDFVASGDSGQELAAGAAGRFRRGECRRQYRDAGMGQHAEGVPLAAGEDRLGVDEGGAGLGEPCALAQHGGRAAAGRLLFLHHRQGVAARLHAAAEQGRGQRLQGDALGAIDHLGRQLVVIEPGDEGGEFPAQ
jgi:hypothetical protein